MAMKSGLKVSRRSTWTTCPFDSEEAIEANIWLGDTVGEMALYYAMCEVALLGGSFEKLGGQNLIEAAACGCPVIMGPHTFNFAEAAELAQAAGAAQRVDDMAQGVQLAIRIANDGYLLTKSAKAALAFAAAHRGATLKTLSAMGSYLATR